MGIHRPFVSLVLLAALAGCGGTRLLKDPAMPALEHALAGTSDGRLALDLDFVIVRNGPGSWARNGDWDEYLLRLRNLTDAPLEIDEVRVEDSSGLEAGPLAGRRDLVAASRRTIRRYGAQGLKLQAGRGGGALVATGVGIGVVGYGGAVAGATNAFLGAGGAAGGGGAAVAGGLVLAAPVLVGVGIVRAVNNARVDDRIGARATPLPLSVPAGATVAVDLFFPLSPSPRAVSVHYRTAAGPQVLRLDAGPALSGLHLPAEAGPTDKED